MARGEGSFPTRRGPSKVVGHGRDDGITIHQVPDPCGAKAGLGSAPTNRRHTITIGPTGQAVAPPPLGGCARCSPKHVLE
eukprot:scaffold1041_cov124-Isochrysis_galbana.AAC.18